MPIKFNNMERIAGFRKTLGADGAGKQKYMW